MLVARYLYGCQLGLHWNCGSSSRPGGNTSPLDIWEIQCFQFSLKTIQWLQNLLLKSLKVTFVSFVVLIPIFLLSNHIFQCLQSQFLCVFCREVPIFSPPFDAPVASSTSRLDQSPVLHSPGGDPAELLGHWSMKIRDFRSKFKDLTVKIRDWTSKIRTQPGKSVTLSANTGV